MWVEGGLFLVRGLLVLVESFGRVDGVISEASGFLVSIGMKIFRFFFGIMGDGKI